MLTPAFSLSQDAGTLTIEIKAPYAKISDSEIFVDDTDFKFYSKPYYLRLNLPGSVLEDGREKATYDSDTGTFLIVLPKKQPGENFEGLDMLTKLLAPSGNKKQSTQQPLIEVLDRASVTPSDGAEAAEDVDADDAEFDWQLDQEPYTEDLAALRLDQPKYGFADHRAGVLARIQSECSDVVDLRDADVTPARDRRQARLDAEQGQFDEEVYLFDLLENEAIPPLLQYSPPWVQEYKLIKGGMEPEDVVEFTDKEREQMRKLPRKEYLLDAVVSRKVFLGLVDIVFAYCYNHRTTEGDNTVESSWTIAKLSATLSWLDSYSSLRDALVTSYRRCLCYPLYRHWKLTQKVHRDTVKMFYVGRRRLLKCLLEIHDILLHNDPQYILNDLYITDYCVWIQSVSSKQLDSLVKELSRVHLEKKHLYLELDLLEHAAELTLAEDRASSEQTTQDIAESFRSLDLAGHTDRQATLAEQIKELSMQSGTSAPTQGDIGVSTALLKAERETASSSGEEDSDDESSSSEYTTATDDETSDDCSGEEDNQDTAIGDGNVVSDVRTVVDEAQSKEQTSSEETQVEVTMRNIIEGSDKVTNKPSLITELDSESSSQTDVASSSSTVQTKCAEDNASLNF